MTTRSDSHVSTTAYCVKCKQQRDIKDGHSVTFKNGTPATQGVCSTCGTKVTRLAGRAKSATGA